MEKKNVKIHLEMMLVFVLLCFGRNVQADTACCLKCLQLCGYKGSGCFAICRKNCAPDYCTGMCPQILNNLISLVHTQYIFYSTFDKLHFF